jgi:hypothetical protein
MTREINKEFIKYAGGIKVFRAENANTNNNLKSAWKTEKFISPNERIVTTPSGKFQVTEKNGHSVRLTRIDHLEIK